jgi:hypothetical protein
MGRSSRDATAEISGNIEVEVGDIIWTYDSALRQPVMCVFVAVNSDKWLRVKKHPYIEPRRGEWHSNLPEKFFSTQQECIDAEISRLRAFTESA